MKNKFRPIVKLRSNFLNPVAHSVGLLVIGTAIVCTSMAAEAQRRTFRTAAPESSGPTITWDLGGSVGNYNGTSYNEANLGVNWFLQDYLVWRNSIFGRFPQELDPIYGLDTSLRLQHAVVSDDGNLGLSFFGGPGYRISEAQSSALFGEAGLVLKLGGLNIGGGVKAFQYTNPGLDSSGTSLPKTDTVYFIILSGGGTL